MERCDFCSSHDRHFTAIGSKNKAEIWLINSYLSFLGDNGADYRVKCRYCPICGKDLQEKDSLIQAGKK